MDNQRKYRETQMKTTRNHFNFANTHKNWETYHASTFLLFLSDPPASYRRLCF